MHVKSETVVQDAARSSSDCDPDRQLQLPCLSSRIKVEDERLEEDASGLIAKLRCQIRVSGAEID